MSIVLVFGNGLLGERLTVRVTNFGIVKYTWGRLP